MKPSFVPVIVSAVLLPFLPSCAPEVKTEPPAAASQPAASRNSGSNTAIVDFCRRNNGRKVGDGECWTLANEAFKATGKRRPGSETRVWGREVDYKAEGVRPGDIIEFQSAQFPNYITGSRHTAIVAQGGKGDIVIADQNSDRGKRVSFRPFNLNAKIRGKVTVYRPS